MLDLKPKYRCGRLKLIRATDDAKITFGRANASLRLALAPILAGAPGPEGPPGPQGPAGDGSSADPGDLTLLFENHLI